MNAELILLGRRIGMGSRLRRRVLVVAICALIVGWLALTGVLTAIRQPHFSLPIGVVLLMLMVMLLNKLVLGGIAAGALIKPFDDGRRRLSVPDWFTQWLRWGVLSAPPPTNAEYKNDERELAMARRAHTIAYRILFSMMVMAWSLAQQMIMRKELHGVGNLTYADLLYLLTSLGFLSNWFLPQTIVLWIEPDMEPEEA